MSRRRIPLAGAPASEAHTAEPTSSPSPALKRARRPSNSFSLVPATPPKLRFPHWPTSSPEVTESRFDRPPYDDAASLDGRLPSPTGSSTRSPSNTSSPARKRRHSCSVCSLVVSQTRWPLETDTISDDRKPWEPEERAHMALAALLVFAAVLLIGLALVWKFYWSAAAARKSSTLAMVAGSSLCTSGSCLQHAEAFVSTMDVAADPCDNFYRYMCGGWTRRTRQPVYDEIWRGFLKRVYDSLSDVQAPATGQGPAEKAAAYVEACLNILEGSNVDGVKHVLSRAGITWPERSVQALPDVLNALFYMSRRIHTPVLFDVLLDHQPDEKFQRSMKPMNYYFNPGAKRIDIREQQSYPSASKNVSGVKSGTRRMILFTLDRHFDSVHSQLQEKMVTSGAREHFEASYTTFATGENASRLAELFDDYIVMQSQLTRNSRQRNSLSTTTKGISSFLDLAPSLNRARWEGVLLDYFNTSFGDLDDRVFIQDSRRFSAFFSLHRHFGEAKTFDFFGFLCVQALLPFTNRKLIESFHGDRSNVAAEWQRVYCLSTAYLAFKEAINSLLWNRSTQFKIQGLAHTVNAVFRDTLADNATLLHTESFIPHEVSIEPVFRAIAESGPSNVANSYRSYPDMTNDPLSNKIAVSSLLGSRAKTVTRPKWMTRRARDFVTHEKETAASYENFELSPQHHYFPWFESDVHLAVLYAGLGARLAASMFVALVNFQDDAEAVYAQNDRCLQPGGERVQPADLNLQAAVVSLKIAWNAYAEVSTFVKVKDLLTLKRDAVFFAFNCWLACGRPDGESLCNVPLQQSAQFALVFNCSSTSTMNSTEKCNLFV